jgi:hypothetical protein
LQHEMLRGVCTENGIFYDLKLKQGK